MKNAPKIGYAVSRGVFNGWTKEQEKEFIEYTTPFEAIAARESSFAEHIHELTGKDVPVVLDPVFLKDKKFWHDIAIPPRNQERKYVLLYAVMERAIDSIQKALAFAKEKVWNLSSCPPMKAMSICRKKAITKSSIMLVRMNGLDI